MTDRSRMMLEVGERLVRLCAQAGLDPEAASLASGIGLERLHDAETGEVALTESETAPGRARTASTRPRSSAVA